MFSGLIQEIGVVKERGALGGGARIHVGCSFGGDSLCAGESVAVSGVCLTVTAKGTRAFAADLSAETLSRTTLGRLRPGARVNLERALRAGDRIGGHFVLGHVDAAVAVVAVRESAEFRTLRLRLPRGLEPEVAEKGSVALDGVSLTVSRLGQGWFEVVVIPATLTRTTLGERHSGDLVNVETDVLAKYVGRATAGQAKPALEKLEEWVHEEG